MDANELSPLFGGWIQRVDLIAKSELLLSIRFPGKTIRLLVTPASAGVVAEKPAKAIDGGDLQRALRKRIEGKPFVSLAEDRGGMIIDVRDLRVRLSKTGFEWLAPSGLTVPPMPSSVPEDLPRAESNAAAELKKRIAIKKKKLARLRENLLRDRRRLDEMLAMKKLGELMKTELGKIPRGAVEIDLTDWESGQQIRIALDPALSPKANMERFFSKAKKAERGIPQVEKRIALVGAQIEQLDRGELTADETAAPREPGEQKKAEKKKPIDKVARKFVALDGSEIRVGKGASENDRLTLSFCKGDDVWLHASGTQGAHVVLRVAKGATVNAEALLDAAHLAAHYSGAKNDSKVEVVWTEARHVKKTKGDPPGRVSVAKGRTILVAVDKERIERLFGRR
jgi:predicted ribosome quality control (RQC) complex YloA/Tae2 family protein